MDNLLRLVDHFWLSLQSGQALQLGVWNYLLLVLLVIVEGPLATLLAGAAASAGYLNVEMVFISAAFGNLLADLGWYSIGYAGKVAWALRIGRIFGLRQHHLDQAQQGFSDQAPRLLIFAKLTAAFTIPTLIAAGLAKLPFKRWLPGYAVAEAIWTGILVIVGYHATETITHFDRGIQSLWIVSGAVFLVGCIFLLRRMMLHRQTISSNSKHDC